MMADREVVFTQRPVRVERVPDGSAMELPAGTRAQITQALGGSFSMVVEGQLVRLKGEDADAIGHEVPDKALPLAEDIARDEVHALVWQTLKTCYDPEIPIDIVDLGLIYECNVVPVDDERVSVSIQMTLTAPGCGMGETITNEVRDKIMALPRVAEVEVELVFDPPWTRYRLSEAARLTLGL